MKNQYIVITETNHYGWIAYFTTLSEAQKLLKIEGEIFYIFKYCQVKKEIFNIKIKFPIGEYYNYLHINEYVEELIEENDNYVIITKNKCEDNNLILTYK
jgi:hypothetical protein